MSNKVAFTAKDALRVGAFAKLLAGQTVSSFGDGLTGLSLILLVNAWSGALTAVATLTILQAVPQVTLGLLSGVYVDRYDRRRIMLISDALRAVFVLGLALAVAAHSLPMVYALAFLQATVGTFFSPARAAFTRSVVPEHGLLAANSLMQTASLLASVAGAALSGVLVALTGSRSLAFGIDALTFLISFAFVAWIGPTAALRAAAAPAGVRQVWAELLEGLRLIVRTPVILGVLTVSVVTMLGIGAVNVLFPSFLTRTLGVPEAWMGTIEVAQVIGMVLGGSLAALVMARLPAARVVIVATLGLSVLVASIGAAVNVAMLLGALFLFGLTVAPLQEAASTLMMSNVDQNIVGRTSATFNTLVTVSSLISMAFAGVLGDAIGVRGVFFIGGAFALLAGLAATRMLSGKRAPATAPAAEVEAA